MTDQTTAHKMKSWAIKTLLVLIIVPVLLFSLYTIITLKYVYAKGERAGYLQKFSKKGYVFKTYEGELAMVNLPGAMPEIFYFTVKDEDIAKRVSGELGQRVTLYYNEHRGIIGTWYGDTQYFVKDVKRIETATSSPLSSN